MEDNIASVTARMSDDEQGNKTLEVEITMSTGHTVTAVFPGGAPTDLEEVSVSFLH